MKNTTLGSELRDENGMKMHLAAKDVAFISVFAALYTVLGLIPLFYLFGAYGQFITASLIIAPIIGIILGPIGGTLSVVIGGIAGMAITGNMPIGIFSFVPGTVDALCTGLTFRGRWYASAAIFGSFIIAFAALPSIDSVRYYVWLHALALLILMSPASRLAVRYLRGSDSRELVFGVGILAFIGVLSDHIAGSLLFQLLTPLPQSTWEAIAFVYPIERLLATIAAAIIGGGLIKAMKRAGWQIGEIIA